MDGWITCQIQNRIVKSLNNLMLLYNYLYSADEIYMDFGFVITTGPLIGPVLFCSLASVVIVCRM